jgi:hypothetical protein
LREAAIGHFKWGIVAILTLGLLGPASAAAQQRTAARPVQSEGQLNTLVPEQRFDGVANIRTKKGATASLHVVVRKWEIHGNQSVKRFPEEGFLIVHLHSGKVVTIINGQEMARASNSFWTVPDGASMSVRVTSESAALEVTSVRF